MKWCLAASSSAAAAESAVIYLSGFPGLKGLIDDASCLFDQVLQPLLHPTLLGLVLAAKVNNGAQTTRHAGS